MSSKKQKRLQGQPKLPKDRQWIQWGIDAIPNSLSDAEVQSKAATLRLVPVRTRVIGNVKLVRKPGFFTPKITWNDYFTRLPSQYEAVIEKDGNLEHVHVGKLSSEARRLIRDRLRKLPRRAAFLVFCDLMGAELRSGKYTRAGAAAKMKLQENSVVFILRHRLRLYDMVEPVRRAAGLAYKGGKKTAKTEWPPEVVAALLPFTTPTGVLGLIARALHKDGERTAYRILRHLDRAMARPVGREADLAMLLFRYGMIAGVPPSLRSRERATPAPRPKKMIVSLPAGGFPGVPSVPHPQAPTISTVDAGPPLPPPMLPSYVPASTITISPVDRPSPPTAPPPDGVLCPRCGTLVRVPGGGRPKFCSTCTAPLS